MAGSERKDHTVAQPTSGECTMGVSNSWLLGFKSLGQEENHKVICAICNGTQSRGSSKN